MLHKRLKLWALTLCLSCATLFLAGCDNKDNASQRYLDKAELYLEANDLTKARLELKNAIQINPKSVDAYFLLGQIEEQSGNYNGAFKSYNKVVLLNPDHIKARTRLMRIYLLAGVLPRAEEQFVYIRAKDANASETRLLEAMLAERKGDSQKSISLLETLLAEEGDHNEAIMLLATILSKQKNFPSAEKVLRKGLKNDPSNIRVLVQLAQLYTSMLKFDAAEELLKQVIIADPHELMHKVNLASFYIRQKTPDKAELLYQNAIREKPEDEERQLLLIEYYEKQGDYIKAIKTSQAFITEYPYSPKLRFTLARLYSQLGNDELAINTYRELIALDFLQNDILRAKKNLAELLLKQKKYDETKRLIEQVLTDNPGDLRASLLKGKLALVNHDADTAISMFRSVMKDQPDSLEVAKLLTKAYLQNDRVVLATDTLDKFIDNYPLNVDAKLVLANHHFKLKNYDAAIQVAYSAMTISKNDINVMLLLVQIYGAKGDVSSMQSMLQNIHELYPENLAAYQILGDLFTQKKQYKKAIEQYEMAFQRSGRYLPYMASITSAYISAGHPEKARERIEYLIKLNPNNEVLHLLLAEVFVADGESEAAISSIQNAIKLKPVWSLPYSSLAKLYIEKGETEEAVDIYRSGLEHNPMDERLLTEMAGVYVLSGNITEGISVYRRVLKVNPTHSLAANNLASVLTDERGDKESLEEARKIMQGFESTSNPAFLDTLGWIYHKTGESEKAVELLKRAVYLKPGVPHFHYHLGVAYVDLNNAAAKEQLTKALESPLDFPGRDKAEEYLLKLHQ